MTKKERLYKRIYGKVKQSILSHKIGILIWIFSVIAAIICGLYFNDGVIYYHHNFPKAPLFPGTDYAVSSAGEHNPYTYPANYDLSFFITNHWFECLPTKVTVYVKPTDSGITVNITDYSPKGSLSERDLIIIPLHGSGEGGIRVSLNIENSSYDNYELCIEVEENGREVNNLIRCSPFYVQKVRGAVS